MSMLHIELYDHGYTDTWGEWKIGVPKPEHLQDPTPYLENVFSPSGFNVGIIVHADPYSESVALYRKSLNMGEIQESNPAGGRTNTI